MSIVPLLGQLNSGRAVMTMIDVSRLKLKPAAAGFWQAGTFGRSMTRAKCFKAIARDPDAAAGDWPGGRIVRLSSWSTKGQVI